MNVQLFNDMDLSSRRKVISYAYLAQASKDDNDLLGGISSIFKPIAKQFAGELFEAEKFCSVVEDLYGLKIHPWAALDLTKRLASNGILIEEKLVGDVVQYRYANIEEEYSEVREVDITSVVNRFIEFSRPKLNQYSIDITDEELSDSFLKHLVDLNFIQTTLRTEALAKVENNNSSSADEGEQWRNSVKATSRINSLCAGFVLHAFHNDAHLYDLILKIVSGALIAEVVLNFQEPAINASMERVNVILDTPFLMALLDLSCEKEHEFAEKLCEQITERKANLAVYEHSVDELVGNLRAVISAFENNTSHGATGRRLRDKPFNSYLRQIYKDPSTILKQKNIRILKDLTTETSLKFFTEEQEQFLCNGFGFYYNRIAQERDARSIALTMRYRNGIKIKLKEFYNCHHIFLTENSFIPDKSMDFMLRNRLLTEAHVPPAVSGRYISGLLWVLFGAKGKDLSKQLLLANCAAALEPKSEVISRMHHFLTKIDDSQAKLFNALMGEERAGQYLMQHSLGDASLLTKDNAEQILRNLKNSLTEQIELEAKLKIEETESKAKLDRELLEKELTGIITDREAENFETRSRLLASEAENFENTEKIKKLEQAIANHSSSLAKQAADTEAVYLRKIENIMILSDRKKARYKNLTEVLIFIISSIAALISKNQEMELLSIILTFLASLFGLEMVKLFLMKNFFIKVRDNAFNNMLATKDLTFDQSQYRLNWESKSAEKRN